MTDDAYADIDNMVNLVDDSDESELSHQETCLNLLGRVFKEQGNTDRAETYFTKSFKLKPHCNAAFQHTVGLLYNRVRSLPWERVMNLPEELRCRLCISRLANNV